MMMAFTIEVTIAPKAAPMITATARSSTLPFITNALNSFNICLFFCFLELLMESVDLKLFLPGYDPALDLCIDSGRDDVSAYQLILRPIRPVLEDLVAVDLADSGKCVE